MWLQPTCAVGHAYRARALCVVFLTMLWSLCIPVPTVVSGLLTGKEVAFTLASLRSRVSSHASAKAPCPLSVTPQLSQLSAPRFQAAHQSRAVSVPGLLCHHHHCPSGASWTRPGLPLSPVKDQILWTATTHLAVTQNCFFNVGKCVAELSRKENPFSEAKNDVKTKLGRDKRALSACTPGAPTESWWLWALWGWAWGLAGDKPSGRPPCKQLGFSVGGTGTSWKQSPSEVT